MIANLTQTQCRSGVVSRYVRKAQHQRSLAHDGTANGGDLRQPRVLGALPSFGSEGHADGSCKRCAFFIKGICLSGKECTHCHFPHDPRPRHRKRRVKRSQGYGDEEPQEEEPSACGLSAADDSCMSKVLLYLADGVDIDHSSGVASVRLLTISSKEDEHEAEFHTDQYVDDSTKDVSTMDKSRERHVQRIHNNIRREEIAMSGVASVRLVPINENEDEHEAKVHTDQYVDEST